MNVLIVYWHPEPQSFNHAMLEVARETLARAGHALTVSDLYAQAFDPVSDRRNFRQAKDPSYLKPQVEEIHASETDGFVAPLDEEMRRLEACDLMIWQFPLWWFGLPAVLKGWVDRVFAMGRFYGGGRVYEKGVLRGKRAMVATTTGGPGEAYQPGGSTGDISAILRPIHRGMFRFVGFDVLAPHIVYSPVRVSDETRREELAKYAARLESIESESAIDVGEY